MGLRTFFKLANRIDHKLHLDSITKRANMAGILVSLLIYVFLYILFQLQYNNSIEDVSLQLHKIAKAQQTTIEKWLQCHYAQLNSLAVLRPLKDLEQSQQANKIDDFIKTHEDFAAIAFFDGQGKPQYLSDKRLTSKLSMASQAFLPILQQDKSPIFDLIILPDTGEKAILAASPILTPNLAVEGVVLSIIHTKSLTDQLVTQQDYTWQTYLLDDKGLIWKNYSGEDQRIREEKYFKTQIMAENYGPTTQIRSDNQKVLSILKPIHGTSWYLVSEIENREIMNSIWHRIYPLAFAPLILLLFFIPSVFFLTRRLQPAINLLRSKAQNLHDWKSFQAIDDSYLIYSAKEFHELNRSLEQAARIVQDNLEQLEASRNEALAAAQCESEFLANMSHEIRTPLNAIIGTGELLQETKLDEEQQILVQTFQEAGDNLLSIINDILDVSKAEAGYFRLEILPFNLQKLLNGTIKIMMIKAQKKGLKMELIIDEDVSINLVGDPARLRQILMNLLSNAIKFSTAGTITLRVERKLDAENPNTLRFSVTDQGIGIPEKKLPEIFQRFTQVDSSVTRKYGGTGLGLTLCKLLVEVMGGAITAQSQLGVGSTFSFTVPLSPNPSCQGDQPKPPAPPPQPVLPKGAEYRILLVEDMADNRLLITAYLKKYPYRIDQAENGKEAVDKYFANSYDLVLMDVQMPILDGYAATREIRAIEKRTNRPSVPIIALTAHALQEDVEKSIAAGCNAHLAKPIKKQILLDCLNQYLP